MEVISRQDAKASGLTRYFTEEPCIHGHLAERFTNTGACVACRYANIANWRKTNPHKSREAEMRQRAKNPNRALRCAANAKAWAKANPERKRVQARRWHEKNPDKRQRYNKEWYQKNPEKAKEAARNQRIKFRERIRETIKNWRAANPERVALGRIASRITRRGREANNGGKFTTRDVENLYARQNGECAACSATDSLNVDHYMPIKLGGSSDPSNLQLLCYPCNRSKWAKHPDIWLAELSETVRLRVLSFRFNLNGST